jgi:hypothetical protein
MAQNTAPIYTLTQVNTWAAGVTAANTAMDGTGTVNAVFTAGANGAFLQRIRVKALGTNVATVIRFFLNNGSTNATAANNSLIGELTLPATTASNVTANPDFEYPMNLLMPNGYVINVTLGTAVSAGVSVTGIGGNY